jgi:hypothetical protein
MMMQKEMALKESYGNETIDDFAVRQIIKWLQGQENVDLDALSDIEFIYLPVFDSYSEVQPHALNTRLSLDSDYFCSMIELFFKKSTEEKSEHKINKALRERLFTVLFQFKVTPGIDWNGCFNETSYRKWMNSVKAWSKTNDRYEVTMQTVGCGLSYASLDEEKLPPSPIMEDLNKVENTEIRRGYYIGIINQRGVHFVDPSGKPELKLSDEYKERADFVEAKGYSRYADVLRQISDEYKREAMHNIAESQKRIEC